MLKSIAVHTVFLIVCALPIPVRAQYLPGSSSPNGKPFTVICFDGSWAQSFAQCERWQAVAKTLELPVYRHLWSSHADESVTND